MNFGWKEIFQSAHNMTTSTLGDLGIPVIVLLALIGIGYIVSTIVEGIVYLLIGRTKHEQQNQDETKSS